jgi:hypothetical protein
MINDIWKNFQTIILNYFVNIKIFAKLKMLIIFINNDNYKEVRYGNFERSNRDV